MDRRPQSESDAGRKSPAAAAAVDAHSTQNVADLCQQRIDEFEAEGLSAEETGARMTALFLADLFRACETLEPRVHEAMAQGLSALERLASAAPEINSYLQVSRTIIQLTTLALVVKHQPAAPAVARHPRLGPNT